MYVYCLLYVLDVLVTLLLLCVFVRLTLSQSGLDVLVLLFVGLWVLEKMVLVFVIVDFMGFDPKYGPQKRTSKGVQK